MEVGPGSSFDMLYNFRWNTHRLKDKEALGYSFKIFGHRYKMPID
jgi:hypothetical protein